MLFNFKLKILDTYLNLFQLINVIMLVSALSSNLYAQHEAEIGFQDGIKYIIHSSNGKWENSKALSCSLVMTIGINQKSPEGFLEGPGAIFVDIDNFIYVSDYLADKLKIYDNNGNLYNIISKNNLTENDFTCPGSIIVDQKRNIYIQSAKQNKIVIFSFQGIFIHAIDVPASIFKIIYNPYTYDKFFFIPSFCKKFKDSGIQGPIVPFTIEGFHFPSFGKPLHFDERMDFLIGATIQSQYLFKNRIILVYLYPFEIHIYSTKGDLQTVITRSDTVFTETYQYRSLLLTRRRVGTILPFPDGSFMIAYLDRGEDWIERAKRGDITSYPSIVYDLYDSEGIFLQQFMQPQNLAGILFYSDYKGFVYEISYPKYPDKAGKFVINKYHIEFRNK